MSNLNQQALIEQEKNTQLSLFLEQLSRYCIIDMGNITGATETKHGYRCAVKTNRILQGQVVIYRNVEIVMPGNSGGGIFFEPEGAPCLVFGPLSTSARLDNNTLPGPWSPYDLKYLKCMPVGNPTMWASLLQFDSEGNVTFQMENATATFSRNGFITIRQLDDGEEETLEHCIEINADGKIDASGQGYVYHHNPDGTYYRYDCNPEERGEIRYFESFRDNIHIVARTAINLFVEEDTEDTSEWDQLLEFDNWRYIKTWDDNVKTIIRKDADRIGYVSFAS